MMAFDYKTERKWLINWTLDVKKVFIYKNNKNNAF